MKVDEIITILYRLLGFYISHAQPDSITEECDAVEIAISAIEKERKNE